MSNPINVVGRKLFGNDDNSPVHIKRSGDNNEESEAKKARFSTLITLIEQKCTTSTVVQIHLYDVYNNESLYKFAELNNYLEILDSSHDLQRNKDQNNPLLEYYSLHHSEYIFINGITISPTNNMFNEYENLNNCRTQIAVKNKMKELIQESNINIAFGRVKYSDSTIKPILKQLTALQIDLSNNENINTTIIETHRGGEPNNNQNISKMYKSQISTIFDLNTSLDANFMLDVSGIYDISVNESFNQYVTRIKNEFNSTNKTFPLLRFYSNYFPNAFSAFIKHDELFDGNMNILPETISKILNTYNSAITTEQLKKPPELIENYIREIIENIKLNIDFFESTPKPIYMLHMFSDDKKDQLGINISETNRWTFSIQKGPVTADMVTMELYGIKKRNLTSLISDAFCNTKVKDYRSSLILVSRTMCKITKDTHVIWGKTVGDGVAIETVKLISYFNSNYIALLSSDICCCYRGLHNTGYAVRQHPSKLAGTGFGSTINERKIEIYKNIEIVAFTTQKYKEVINMFWNKYVTDISNIDITEYNSNTYLSDILLPEVKNHFIPFVNTNVKKYFQDYQSKLDNTKNEDNDEICEIIREMYLCPYITDDSNTICRGLIIDYMDELKNLIDIINNTVITGINQQRTIDFNIHTDILIKLVSSIEIKLQTIFNKVGDDNTIKQNVVFNLLLLFKKFGDRPLANYINKIVDYISKLPEIKTTLDNKGIIITNYEMRDQYEILYVIFTELYKDVTRNNPQYENRQIAKQPLNILKYLCRANDLHNSIGNNSIEYSSIFFNEFMKEYDRVKNLYSSLPGTVVPGSVVQSQNITEETNFISPTASPIKSSSNFINFIIPANVLIYSTSPSSPTNTNINNDPNYKLDIFQDNNTEIDEYLSTSLNPENNYIEHINDMDEKEKLMDEQRTTADELNGIVDNINRIEDPQQRTSILERVRSIANTLFNPRRRGGTSIIKKQKIRKSHKHKKNKKYTIKKD